MDDTRKELLRSWLTKAASDLRAAQLLLAWMQEPKHPAAQLMADPFNKELTAEYMAWEKSNAVKQIEEVEKLAREHRAHSKTLGQPAAAK